MPHSHLATRLKRKLPPSAPLPSTLQTLAYRAWPLQCFERAAARYGPRFTVYPVAMPPLVILSDPAEIKAVLTAPADILHPGAGTHLTTALFGDHAFILCDEEEHRCARAAVTPALRRTAIERPTYQRIVAEIAERDIATWPTQTPFAAHPRLRSLALRVILRSIFGEETPPLAALHRRILELPQATASLVIQEPLLRYLPGWHRAWRLFQAQRHDVYELTSAIVKQRRHAHSQPQDTLDLLLAADDEHGQPMSEERILDHLVCLVVSGHETTAALLAWTLQLIAHHPRVQQRLIDEIDAGTENTYMTATIQETLRHRGALLFTMPRKVAKPIQIGDWTYKPPTHLLPAVHLLHHDPKLYPEPQRFWPERFLATAPDPYTWLPWGGGRRRCPGQHMALQETEIVLGALLTHRTVRPASRRIERGHWRNTIITPHAGARIRLAARRRAPTLADRQTQSEPSDAAPDRSM